MEDIDDGRVQAVFHGLGQIGPADSRPPAGQVSRHQRTYGDDREIKNVLRTELKNKLLRNRYGIRRMYSTNTQTLRLEDNCFFHALQAILEIRMAVGPKTTKPIDQVDAACVRQIKTGRSDLIELLVRYRPDWSELAEEMTPERWKKVWHKGDGDEFMAKVILDEFVSKNEKALIYSGSHHAFTRYQQPVYDFEKKAFIRFSTNRMGNIVQQKIPDKVFKAFREFGDRHLNSRIPPPPCRILGTQMSVTNCSQ